MADKITLDPESEFESVLIEMVTTFRAKSVGYADEDAFRNFLTGSLLTGLHPLRYCEALLAKHVAALMNWYKKSEVDTIPETSSFSDDGFMDRAVYAVIAIALYRRYTA